MKAPSIAVVGATGAVGREVVRILEERDVTLLGLRPIASPRSAGKTIPFRGEDVPVVVIDERAFNGVDLVIWDTPDEVARVMLGETNSQAIVTLARVRPYALWLLIPASLATLVLTVKLIRREAAERDNGNAAKCLYQGSSLALIAAIAYDPLAGFIAYVAAHAIEYFVVVYKTMEGRYGRKRDRSSFLGLVAHRRNQDGGL